MRHFTPRGAVSTFVPEQREQKHQTNLRAEVLELQPSPGTVTHMMLILVVYVLAVARITRLVNGDKILDRLRLYPATKLREATLLIHEARRADQPVAEAKARRNAERWDKTLYFVGCPWCVGMWVALFTAWIPLWFAHNPVAQYLGVALAASHLVGVFAFAADTEEIQIEDGPPADDD